MDESRAVALAVPARSRPLESEAPMGLFHIIWSVIVGFFVGLLARALMPGADHMSFLATSILGIAGSFVGGFLGNLISKPAEGATVHPVGFAMSVVGAIVLLFATRLF
jgi:uncharacterized membrane protein YeaQ/YmgE (transglycosylase-associated protein family)